jgi:hypothetical protein
MLLLLSRSCCLFWYLWKISLRSSISIDDETLEGDNEYDDMAVVFIVVDALASKADRML